MSGNAQLGYHPDADSLNAFAEQALAGREREQIVAHLAACSRCREIVFLVQQANVEIEPAAAARRTVEREPWYKRWRLAWVPVGALAAGITVAYVVHVRHENTAVEMAQMANEVRTVNPPSIAPAPPAQEAKSENSTEAVAKKTAPAARRPPAAAMKPEAAVPALPANEPVNALAGLKVGSEVQELSRQRVTPETTGEMQAASRGTAGLVNADKVQQQQFHVTAAAAPVTQAEVAPAPARSVAAANRLGGELAVFAAKQMKLPSGLTVASMATAQHKVLAVDKAGAVFLSADGGAHWDAIDRQWTGKAVEVRTQMEVKTTASAPVGKGLLQSVFELVNDHGQVWVSTDGRSWKAR